MTRLAALLLLAATACATDDPRTVVVSGEVTEPPIVGLTASVSPVELAWATATTTTTTEPPSINRQGGSVASSPLSSNVRGGGVEPWRVYPKGCNMACAPANRELGRHMAAERGWSAVEFACADRIAMRESGWDHRQPNIQGPNETPLSSAFGIPQALTDLYGLNEDWKHDPAAQINWFYDYVIDRYGGPCEAWEHKRTRGWY